MAVVIYAWPQPSAHGADVAAIMLLGVATSINTAVRDGIVKFG